MAIGKYIAVGEYARAMIAVGDSGATGSVQEYLTGSGKVAVDYIKDWLNVNVPVYLAWAKEIFEFFIF